MGDRLYDLSIEAIAMTALTFWLLVAALSVVFAVFLGMFIHEGLRGPDEDDGRLDDPQEPLDRRNRHA
jgi:hypothetical protein